MRGARVLVIGGTGFVGSRLAGRLAAEGAVVAVVGRRPSLAAERGLAGRVEALAADLRDPASLAAAVRAADPEFVFHLARREGSDLREELAGSLAVASALAGAKRLVRWVRTAHATREGLGRGADAEIARALAARGPDPATIELYLPYGPGMNDGTWPLDLIDALAAGRPAPRAGAKDLLFVDDAAEGYRLAALTPAAEGRTIALGGGRLIPPSEVEDSARRALGLPSREGSSSAPTGPGHPADLSAARELLAWSPRTPLDEGLRVLVEWRHGRVRR